MLGRARILEQGNIEDQGRDQTKGGGGGEGARGDQGKGPREGEGEFKSPPHETSCHGGGAGFPSDPTESLFSKILMNTIKSSERFGNDL